MVAGLRGLAVRRRGVRHPAQPAREGGSRRVDIAAALALARVPVLRVHQHDVAGSTLAARVPAERGVLRGRVLLGTRA